MKIAIIGCGIMGSAFARAFRKQNHELSLCDRNAESGKALADELDGQFTQNPKEATRGVDCILLAIKPKDLAALSNEMQVSEGQMLISILAGVKTTTLKKYFPKANVVRGMPNLALTCGESVIAIAKNVEISESAKKTVGDLLDGLGMILWTEEDKIDAISALAGSGPAFVIAIIESMIESGIAMGIKADVAKELVLQTIQGSVALVRKGEGHPGKIRWEIAAPGGTTIEGLKAFEKNAVRYGIIETILATYRKAKELDS